MPAHQRTYRLAPSWNYPPDGSIALGNVIKDPKQPHRALFRGPPDDTLVTTTKQTNFVFSPGDEQSAQRGLWLSVVAPLLGVSRDAATNTLKHENDIFRFQELETRQFGPTDESIATRLYHADVVDYTSNQSWKSVYIITGIKIAYGASMKSSIGGNHTSLAEMPANTGSEGQPNRQQKKTVQIGASDGFVFAYELLKLQPRNSEDQSFNARPFDKGALLGEDTVAEQDKAALAEKLLGEWDVLGDEPMTDVPSSEIAVEIDGLDCKVILSSES